VVSIRTELAAAIRASSQLPARWTVKEYESTPANLTAPRVQVSQAEIRPNAQAPRIWRDTDFQVAVLVPELDPAKVEDAVEDAVETLLDILEAMPGLVWSDAKRAKFDDKFHGYAVTVTITNEKETA